MKKVFSLLVVALSAILLVACGSQESLEGKYYEFDKEDSYLYEEPEIIINGNIGEQGGKSFTVDDEKKVFSANGFELSYVFEDGQLSVNGEVYLKKGSKAYKNAVKLDNKRKKNEQEKIQAKIDALKKEINGKYYFLGRGSTLYGDEKVSEDVAFEIIDNKIVVNSFGNFDSGEYQIDFLDSGQIEIDKKTKFNLSYNSNVLRLEEVIIKDGQEFYSELEHYVKK